MSALRFDLFAYGNYSFRLLGELGPLVPFVHCSRRSKTTLRPNDFLHCFHLSRVYKGSTMDAAGVAQL